MSAVRTWAVGVVLAGVVVGAVLADGPHTGGAQPGAPGAPGRAAAAAPVEGPRLAVDPPSFDFGRMMPEKEQHKEFTLRNVGTGDLKIENVSSDCGCTAAVLESQDVIRPGDTVHLRVTVHPPGGPKAYPLKKSVAIRSNDPSRPLTSIGLTAEVMASPNAP